MENSKNNNSLKIAIALLAVGLITSLGFNFKQSKDVENEQVAFAEASIEKNSILKNLEALKAKYDVAITEKTSISDSLVIERDKIISLMDEIKKSKNNLAALSGYKQKYFALQQKMNILIAENDTLKKENGTLLVQRDSTLTVLNTNKIEKETLLAKNTEMNKTIEVASKLTVSNLKASPYKIRSSGKQVPTTKASKVDALKIDFTIAENKIAKTGDTNYYVQVIDANNNVLGEKKTISFDDKELSYSFISNVKYENKAVDVSEILKGEDFPKGNYFVNVFDQKELVSNSSFVLK